MFGKKFVLYSTQSLINAKGSKYASEKSFRAHTAQFLVLRGKLSSLKLMYMRIEATADNLLNPSESRLGILKRVFTCVFGQFV